jgi:molecular chaperone GrpE
MTMQEHERTSRKKHRDDAPAGPAPGDAASSGEADVSVERIEVSEQAAALVKQLQLERDEAVDGRLRALADFRNYQRRSLENEQRAMQTGAAKVVKAMMPAMDHFDLALNQRADQLNVKQLLAAVSIVRDEFSKALQSQGVEKIAPAKGEPFDPNRHEAVMRQSDPGVGPNSVVNTMQAGYAMGDTVLRPATVAVSPGEDG